MNLGAINRQWFGPPMDEGRAIVLLHEGLGSVSAWGGFCQQLTDITGWPVLAYDRAGYGRSAAKPGPWPASFMHDEAKALSELLSAEQIHAPLLVGHSDGASIALLYPHHISGDQPMPLGIVSLAAHVMVEPVSIDSILALRHAYAKDIDTPLKTLLARHHDDIDATFESWSEVWVSERFTDWAIDTELASVACDVLAIQGGDDKYGTRAQLDRLASAVSGCVDIIDIPGCDHWPHREATSLVLAEIVRFTGRFA